MRDVTINGRSATLHEGSRDRGVVFAHGFLSTKDDERLMYAAHELAVAGFPALRVDLSGRRRPISVEAWEEDVREAVRWMRDRVDSVVVVGHSLGGLTAFRCSDVVDGVVAWAPVTEPPVETMQEFRDSFEENDGMYVADVGDETFLVDPVFFDERRDVSQEDLLSPVSCPVLVIHGVDDDTIPVEHSDGAMQYLDGELVTVEDGHNFSDTIQDVVKMTREWIENGGLLSRDYDAMKSSSS